MLEQLKATLIGMDDDVWGWLSSGNASSRSMLEVYLEHAGIDPSGAWAALCGEAVLHIRAKRQSAAPEAVGESVAAELGQTVSIIDPQREGEWWASRLPAADVLVRQACREEDLIKAQTVALYAAWRVEKSRWLQETRYRLLRGILIPVEKVTHFIDSPAIKLLTLVEIEKLGVQSSRAFSTLTREDGLDLGETGFQSRNFGFYFDDYGFDMTRRVDSASMISYRGPNDGELAETFKSIEDIPFLPGSLFDDLLTAADYLSSCLLRCGIEPALRFLLSGLAPASFPVDADWLPSLANGGDSSLQLSGKTSWSDPVSKASHISLTFPLWLSADVAEQAFRQVQRAALGAENRPFKEQYVRMFYFVLCERRRRGIVGAGTEGERRQIWLGWNELCRQAGEDGHHRIQMGVEAPEMPNPLSELDPAWVIESFTYFNTTCGRLEERLFPSFF